MRPPWLWWIWRKQHWAEREKSNSAGTTKLQLTPQGILKYVLLVMS